MPIWATVAKLRPFFFKRGLFSPPKWIWVTIHTEMCYFSRIVGFQNFVKSCLACSLLRQSPLKITWPNTICFHMKKICGKPTSEIFVALSRISGRKSCFSTIEKCFTRAKSDILIVTLIGVVTRRRKRHWKAIRWTNHQPGATGWKIDRSNLCLCTSLFPMELALEV